MLEPFLQLSRLALQNHFSSTVLTINSRKNWSPIFKLPDLTDLHVWCNLPKLDSEGQVAIFCTYIIVIIILGTPR